MFSNNLEKQKVLSKILFNGLVDRYKIMELLLTELYPLKFLGKKYKISSLNLIEDKKRNC